jgi:hypothetical protein
MNAPQCYVIVIRTPPDLLTFKVNIITSDMATCSEHGDHHQAVQLSQKRKRDIIAPFYWDLNRM